MADTRTYPKLALAGVRKLIVAVGVFSFFANSADADRAALHAADL